MLTLEEIESKLSVLRYYDEVFNGDRVRQQLPACCGRILEFCDLLKSDVKLAYIDIEGDSFTLFEVTCPTCGRMIPPEWSVWIR